MKTKENKDNKPNWRDWAVSNPNKQDGVRPKKKTQKGKKEESEIIAEQTKDFLKRGGKIQGEMNTWQDEAIKPNKVN